MTDDDAETFATDDVVLTASLTNNAYVTTNLQHKISSALSLMCAYTSNPLSHRSYVASCADLSGDPAMEIAMKCSSVYCKDADVGVSCYCDTLFGPSDPTWEHSHGRKAAAALRRCLSSKKKKRKGFAILHQSFALIRLH